MKLNLIETKEILDLEEEIGFELVVNEQIKKNNTTQYIARFEDGEIMQGNCLFRAYGIGDTVDIAIRDYCREIENSRMVFLPYTADRKEFVIPKLIHTRLINSNTSKSL